MMMLFTTTKSTGCIGCCKYYYWILLLFSILVLFSFFQSMTMIQNFVVVVKVPSNNSSTSSRSNRNLDPIKVITDEIQQPHTKKQRYRNGYLHNENATTTTTTANGTTSKKNHHQNENHNNNDSFLLTEKIWWTRKELIQLLDEPNCVQALQRAKQRKPIPVPLCPLCTRGSILLQNQNQKKKKNMNLQNHDQQWNNITTTTTTTWYENQTSINTTTNNNIMIQYMKIPKAGSSTMVRYLTGLSQSSSKEAKILCKYQPTTEYRYTIVRHPFDRIVSAYHEVDYHGKKRWMISKNITYNKSRQKKVLYKQQQQQDQQQQSTDPAPVQRFLLFLHDYFSGRMLHWDAGMPHHVISAALHLDALRHQDNDNDMNDIDNDTNDEQQQQGSGGGDIVKNDRYLPHLTGRLEYVDEFMKKIRKVVRLLKERQLQQQQQQYGNDKKIQKKLKKLMMSTTKLRSERVRKTKSSTSNTTTTTTSTKDDNDDSLFVGLEWIIQTLFEEDYICFGYPMMTKTPTTTITNNNMNDTNQLPIGTQQEKEFNVPIDDDTTTETDQQQQRRIENYLLSKEIFTDEILTSYQMNYMQQEHQSPPACETHYYDGNGQHHHQVVVS